MNEVKVGLLQHSLRWELWLLKLWLNIWGLEINN